MQTKICSQCHIEKQITDFYKCDDVHYRTYCKKCSNERDRNNEAKKLGLHEWYLKNKQKVLESQKEYREHNKEKIREYQKQYDKIHKRIRKYNKEKSFERYRKYKAKDPERFKKYARDYRDKHPNHDRVSILKNKYGITLEIYNEMLKNQNGVCAICGDGMKYPLCVDHNHITNEVRGLLCRRCNISIGFVMENIATLENMLEYLQKELAGCI